MKKQDKLEIREGPLGSIEQAGALRAPRSLLTKYMAKTSNSYGHPHQVTIDALNQVGAVIYGTDMLGTIVITTNGQSVSPVTWFRLE